MAVIMAIWTVLLFYLWLCVVSHYQILGEVMSMGSDKVKVLQEVGNVYYSIEIQWFMNYWNSNIRIVLFSIPYLIIFKNRIYSVFGIRTFLNNRVYSVFGLF